jgi:hypothetical protein
MLFYGLLTESEAKYLGSEWFSHKSDSSFHCVSLRMTMLTKY